MFYLYRCVCARATVDLQTMFEDQYYGGHVSLKDPESPKLKCPKSSSKAEWEGSEDQDNKTEQAMPSNKSYIGKVHSIVTKDTT